MADQRGISLVELVVAMGILGALFTIREWWWLYAVGIWIYMALVPAVEASEQTVIQKVVPFTEQGRVFGFAQSLETAAAPITAFLIGPIAQFWIIPAMTDGTLAGAIYFMTPLSLQYVREHLTPQLADAVAGKAPREIVQ